MSEAVTMGVGGSGRLIFSDADCSFVSGNKVYFPNGVVWDDIKKLELTLSQCDIMGSFSVKEHHKIGTNFGYYSVVQYNRPEVALKTDEAIVYSDHIYFPNATSNSQIVRLLMIV